MLATRKTRNKFRQRASFDTTIVIGFKTCFEIHAIFRVLRNNRKQVVHVGLIYTKQFVSQPCQAAWPALKGLSLIHI